jgi:FkbM family methyltransferase
MKSAAIRPLTTREKANLTVGRANEYAITALRNVLHKRNLDIVRNPYWVTLVRTLGWLDLDTILDVGANIGQFGSGIRASGFQGRIVSCEPLSDAFTQLEHRAGRTPMWTALNTAVGATTGTIEINVSANSYSSSVLTVTDTCLSAAPKSRVVRSASTPITTVQQVVEAHNITPARTLLKIDTQGYEAAVLDGAGDTLSQFAAVQLELSLVELYEGQALFNELDARLRDSGFVLFSLEPGFSDPTTGRMLQCDGFYVSSVVADREAKSVNFGD